MAAPKHITFVQLDLFPMPETEEWRPVVGWESFYEVSNFGRVRSLDRPTSWVQRYRQVAGADPNDADRPLVQRTTIKKGRVLALRYSGPEKNRVSVMLWAGKAGLTKMIHALVLEAFVGPRPPGYVGNHKDGNPKNNCLANLEWCTHAQNIQHAVDRGLMHTRGEESRGHRWTTAQVIEMRRLQKQGWSGKAIAIHFQVRSDALRAILSRRSWKHIPEEP